MPGPLSILPLIGSLFSGGRRLPWFNSKTLFSVKAHNNVVDAINPLLNPQIVRTGVNGANRVSISDQNIVYEISNDTGGEQSGMHYEFEYDVAKDYTTYAVVRVSPSNASSTNTLGEDDGSRPGVYIAIVDVAAGSPVPRSPIQSGGENGFWQWMSTWPEDCPLG
jgi:hypothetical protein